MFYQNTIKKLSNSRLFFFNFTGVFLCQNRDMMRLEKECAGYLGAFKK